MADVGDLLRRHVIVVTVGLSILEKTLNNSEYQHIYDRWMGAGISGGQLSRFDLAETEQGTGSSEQLEVERKCFDRLRDCPDISREVRRKKQNRYSAEVSSLYLILKHKNLHHGDCRVTLIATDSADGIIAARINKRLIAHCIFGCPRQTALEWRHKTDDGNHESLGQISIIRVPGLQVKNALLLKTQGMEELERAIVSEGDKFSGGEKIINVTGGFKGIIPIVVSIAWLHGWLPTYLYEETDQLTDLPRPTWVKQEEKHKGPATNIVVYGSLESSDG